MVFCSPLTYGLQCESVHSLLVLLSAPVFCVLRPAAQMRSFRSVMGVSAPRAAALARALLASFSDQAPAPSSYLSEEGGSLVLGIASGMWNILTFGYGSQPAAADTPAVNGTAAAGGDATVGADADLPSTKPLADASLLLLLVLSNHCTEKENPYRDALFRCTNANAVANASSKNGVPPSPSTAVNMAQSNHVDGGSKQDGDGKETAAPSFHIDFGR